MIRVTRDGVNVPKARRRRLARAELLMLAAMKVQEWADDAGDRNDHTIPFMQWPASDPFREIGLMYGLTGEDLALILDDMAQLLEDKAERFGYEETWEVDDDTVVTGYPPAQDRS